MICQPATPDQLISEIEGRVEYQEGLTFTGAELSKYMTTDDAIVAEWGSDWGL